MSEETATIRPFSVYSRARPRRIGFLVDPVDCPPELLDSIFSSNYEIWGGRYNPIVPVASGVIADSYWNLLRFVDPDVIYSYCDLPADLIRRLDRELCPIKMERHRAVNPPDRPPYYAPSVCHEQVNISSILPHILKKEGPGYRKPKLLTSAASGSWPYRRQLLRNFGLLEEIMAFKPYPQDQEKITIQNEWTEETLYEELAREVSTIVFPFQASEAYGELPEADDSYQNEYSLIIGDDVQAWIYFWNRIFLLKSYLRSHWHSLCISPQNFQNPSFLDALKKFLNRFAYAHSSTSASLDVLSFTHSVSELEQIRSDIQSHANVFTQSRQLQQNEYPPIAKEHRNYPEFDRAGLSFFERDRTTRQQAAARKSLIRIPDSEFALDRGNWMMDLRVEHVHEFSFYTNEKLWWMLPRKRELAGLFIKEHQARISVDFSISVEMIGQNVFELLVPDESSVIHSALGAGFQSHWGNNFEIEREKPNYELIELSDKGKYTNGVIALFGGLQNTGMFFENSFWRYIVEMLSKRDASSEEETKARIRAKLTKQKAILARVAAEKENALEWLSQYILNLARQQHMLDKDISFKSLDSIFHEQREVFIKKNPDFRKDTTEAGIGKDRKEATEELHRVLQSLTDDGVFLQGVRLHCKNCGSYYWQEVGEVKQQNKCHGCGAAVSLSIESQWRYRLNQLVRNAVAFHGCVPVILNLHTLRSCRARNSFLYAPGIALYKGWDDETPSAEIDLVCISDGKLILGEIKTSCEEFIQSELSKLADLSKGLKADVAVLGCFRDPKQQISQKKADLEGLLSGSLCQVWAEQTSVDAFEPTPDPL